jgi:phosphate transport system permease protein
MRAVVTAVALAVVGLVAGMIGAIIVRGAPGLSIAFLFGTPERLGLAGGIWPIIVNTGVIVGGAVLLAVPIGVGTALWLAEFAPTGRWVTPLQRLIEALAGIPSVLYGLFGFSLFAVGFGWNWSLLTGLATLALMLLPIIIQTATEAVRMVDVELREGARALGATRWETAHRVLLPTAAPAILTGALLALGRAMGESAAVLLTAGGDLRLPHSPLDQGRPLAAHLYLLTIDGGDPGRVWTTALVLVGAILLIQLVADRLAKRLRG